jgi:hypothetical protein
MAVSDLIYVVVVAFTLGIEFRQWREGWLP